MTIKFGCPQCKNVLSVADKLAGKAGKCPKCAASIRIPTPKLQQAAPGAVSQSGTPSGLNSAMDELTESDFNRHSPFESVYSPPKVQSISNEVLQRTVSQGGREKKKKPTGMPGILVAYAIHNLFQAAGYFVLVVLMLAAVGLLDEAMTKVPFLASGILVGALIYGFLGLITLVTGIGLLTKKVWGYAFATASYVFHCLLYAFNVLSSFGDRNRLIGALISLIIAAFLTTYFFRPNCRRFYKITGWQLPLISVGIGALLGIIAGGILLALGMFVPTEQVEGPTGQ